MRYYLIAGERSGDLHGGNLLRSISKHDPQMTARGFGGGEMRQAGMDVTVHYEQLAFMGFLAVIANVRKISGFMRQCKSDIEGFKPDVLILIDYGGFNMRMAKWAKGKGIRVFYYISPKVWAWNTKRAWKLKATVDRMYCILPFEKEFFKKFDWEVDYVGNPVLDAVKKFRPHIDFKSHHRLDPNRKVVALLPGSRKMELRRMLPVMASVARRNPDYQFVVAAVSTLPRDMYAAIEQVPGVRLVFESTYDLLAHADAALVTSGTATLETALFRVPEALLYKASLVEEKLVRAIIQVPYIGLVNLIVDKPTVREFIQKDMTTDMLHEELNRLLHDQAYRASKFRDYDELMRILDTGSASENAGRMMVERLKSSIGA